jgi:hypothetical protein
VSRNTLKSIGAMLAGILVGAGLSIATDTLLRMAGVFPPFNINQAMSNPLLLLATAYRALYGVLGAYITAWLAHPIGRWVTRWSLGL